MTEAILDLHRKKKSIFWDNYNINQALLFSKIPKTLFSAFQQLLDGDYDEANATLRISYESLLRILYIQKYPKKADDVILNKKGIFVAANVLTQEYHISTEDKLYKILSYPVHSFIDKIIIEFIEGQKSGSITLNLGYEANEKALYAGMNRLITVLYFALRIFTKIFQKKLVAFETPNYKPLVEALKRVKLDIHLKNVALIIKQLEKYIT